MPVLPTLSTTSCECAREALLFYQFHFPCSAATDAGTLKTAGIGGAKHCIFHVRIEGENGLPDTVDFAVASPDVVRLWVDGLSSLLHIGSVGIGLQIKQPGGRFIVVGAIKDSPAAASGLFCSGDVIEAIDTMALTPSTAFSVFEALLLGLDNTPVSLSVDRRGQKVPSPCLLLTSPRILRHFPRAVRCCILRSFRCSSGCAGARLFLLIRPRDPTRRMLTNCRMLTKYPRSIGAHGVCQNQIPRLFLCVLLRWKLLAAALPQPQPCCERKQVGHGSKLMKNQSVST